MAEQHKLLRHPVPEAILARIGDITVSFALLESAIQSVAGSLIAEHQRVGQIITAELSFQKLRALLVSLYIERHSENDNDFETLRSLNCRAAELEGKRNQITHSIWAAGDAPGTVTRIKTTAKESRGIHFVFEQMDVAAFKAIADDLKKLAREYLHFHFHLLKSGKAINNPFEKTW